MVSTVNNGCAKIHGLCEPLTLVGAVGMCLIAVVPAVVVPVTSPVLWDAAATITLELGARTRVTAAILIAVVSAVII